MRKSSSEPLGSSVLLKATGCEEVNGAVEGKTDAKRDAAG